MIVRNGSVIEAIPCLPQRDLRGHVRKARRPGACCRVPHIIALMLTASTSRCARSRARTLPAQRLPQPGRRIVGLCRRLRLHVRTRSGRKCWRSGCVHRRPARQGLRVSSTPPAWKWTSPEVIPSAPRDKEDGVTFQIGFRHRAYRLEQRSWRRNRQSGATHDDVTLPSERRGRAQNTGLSRTSSRK